MKFRELIEARDKSVSTEFRIALGKLKGMYGDDETPSIKDLEKDAEMVAKKAKIEDIEGFVKYAKTQITQSMSESELQKEYQEYFEGLLKKYNVKSPAEMDEPTMKKFFNEVSSGWVKGKGEISESREDLDEINEASDMDIIKKVSKKALGGNVNNVIDQGDGYYTINVAGSVIPWKDFKSLEINFSSFEIDNIDFDDNDILIRKK